MSIAENLQKIQSTLPEEVRLVAVSKTKPNSDLEEAYAAGQRIFGENKVQELAGKHEALPKDIEWHMIGHLQRNKVKYIAPFVALIHGVDSGRLLAEINKQAVKNDRIIDVLLQVHIADEETKFGFDEEELTDFIQGPVFLAMKNVRVVGLMGMATYTSDQEQIRSEFASLSDLFQRLKANNFQYADYFKEISMGMSGDYPIAIEEGSTLVRVGSAIFGSRNYG